MTRSVIRISKATVKAWAASFATLIAVGLLALFIVDAIPSTPFAQMQRFEDINSNNPAVYGSGLFLENAPLANFWDGIVITSVSFFIAGLPYGWIAGRRGQRPVHTLLSAALCSVAMSGLIFGLGWMGTAALSRETYVSSGMVPPTLVPTLDYWKTGAVQTAVWTLAFLIGMFLITLVPRRTAGARPKQAPTA